MSKKKKKIRKESTKAVEKETKKPGKKEKRFGKHQKAEAVRERNRRVFWLQSQRPDYFKKTGDLQEACAKGDRQCILKALSQLGKEVSEAIAEPDEKGETLIHIALSNGALSLASLLLRLAKPRRVEIAMKEDIYGSRLLHAAVSYGDPKAVELVLGVLKEDDVFVSAISANEEGISPLYEAVCQGNHVLVALILKAAGRRAAELVMERDERGWNLPKMVFQKGTAVMLPIIFDALGDEECQKAVKSGKIDSHELFIFAVYGDSGAAERVIKVLGEAGAFRAAISPNEDGDTPLHEAVLRGRDDLVRFVLQAAGDRSPELVMMEGAEGWNLLHIAARYGTPEMLFIIFDALKDRVLEALRLGNAQGQTPFCLSLLNNNSAISPGGMGFLLRDRLQAYLKQQQRGDEFYSVLSELAMIPDKQGRQLLHMALRSRHHGIFMFVRRMLGEREGEAFGTRDNEGYTPLHLALSLTLKSPPVDPIAGVAIKHFVMLAENSTSDIGMIPACDGNTLLHTAVRLGIGFIIKKVLVLLGDSLPAAAIFKNDDGKSPIDLACEAGKDLEIIKMIIAAVLRICPTFIVYKNVIRACHDERLAECFFSLQKLVNKVIDASPLKGHRDFINLDFVLCQNPSGVECPILSFNVSVQEGHVEAVCLPVLEFLKRILPDPCCLNEGNSISIRLTSIDDLEELTRQINEAARNLRRQETKIGDFFQTLFFPHTKREDADTESLASKDSDRGIDIEEVAAVSFEDNPFGIWPRGRFFSGKHDARSSGEEPEVWQEERQGEVMFYLTSEEGKKYGPYREVSHGDRIRNRVFVRLSVDSSEFRSEKERVDCETAIEKGFESETGLVKLKHQGQESEKHFFCKVHTKGEGANLRVFGPIVAIDSEINALFIDINTLVSSHDTSPRRYGDGTHPEELLQPLDERITGVEEISEFCSPFLK